MSNAIYTNNDTSGSSDIWSEYGFDDQGNFQGYDPSLGYDDQVHTVSPDGSVDGSGAASGPKPFSPDKLRNSLSALEQQIKTDTDLSADAKNQMLEEVD